MSMLDEKIAFEKQISQKVYESACLRFFGVDGYDVYNCSIPFSWNGKTYLYGRVEKREVWAGSWARLFERTGPDQYTLVPGTRAYQLEDPYISWFHGELVLGGTHVRKQCGEIDTYYGYFYRGRDLEDLEYFTTGPDKMKDIRLVELADGSLGVFSRPRGPEIEEKYGSASIVGFARISSLEELTGQVVSNARPIDGLFGPGEWGGCNQVYLLENGRLGVAAHQSFSLPQDQGEPLAVYMNTAFEFDPDSFEVSNKKIIGTRACYPAGPAKRPQLVDCTFTSGLVMREDGRADLYGGIGDTQEGRIVIDYPFSSPIQAGCPRG